MSDCPCTSGKPFAECCKPALTGERPAPTAEALMRSRYTAFAVGDFAYLGTSMIEELRESFDAADVEEWAKGVEWQGLEIVSTVDGGEGDETGEVEFKASFAINGEPRCLHEHSRFERQDGRWYYVEGTEIRPQPIKREAPKVGRNDPCPCGSGKKFKKCCGK